MKKKSVPLTRSLKGLWMCQRKILYDYGYGQSGDVHRLIAAFDVQ